VVSLPVATSLGLHGQVERRRATPPCRTAPYPRSVVTSARP